MLNNGKKFPLIILLFVIPLLAGIISYFLLQKPAKNNINIFESKDEIKIVSDIPNISVKLVNKDFLENFLQKINFFEENGVRIYTLDSPTTTKSLEIHLTDQEQAYGKFISGTTQKTYQSFSHSSSEDKLKIYLKQIQLNYFI